MSHPRTLAWFECASPDAVSQRNRISRSSVSSPAGRESSAANNRCSQGVAATEFSQSIAKPIRACNSRMSIPSPAVANNDRASAVVRLKRAALRPGLARRYDAYHASQLQHGEEPAVARRVADSAFRSREDAEERRADVAIRTRETPQIQSSRACMKCFLTVPQVVVTLPRHSDGPRTRIVRQGRQRRRNSRSWTRAGAFAATRFD